MYLGKAVTSKPKKVEHREWSYVVAPEKFFSTVIWFLGSGPNRGQSPVEWEDFPSVRPPLEGPRASQAGPRPSQSGLRASQAGLRASQPVLRASQLGLRGSEACLAGYEA